MSDEILFDCLHSQIVNYCLTEGSKVSKQWLSRNFIRMFPTVDSRLNIAPGKRFVNTRIHWLHNRISSDRTTYKRSSQIQGWVRDYEVCLHWFLDGYLQETGRQPSNKPSRGVRSSRQCIQISYTNLSRNETARTCPQVRCIHLRSYSRKSGKPEHQQHCHRRSSIDSFM